MYSIFKKEVNLFLSSLVGQIALIVFFLATGLFIWVFPETNVLDYGFATLQQLFVTGPWVFMFLIPAITMRSFSEELSTGTFELLATRPVRDIEIIFGKYLAALMLVLFSLIPTLIYFYTVYQLGSPPGNMDIGATWGSYIGLLLLGGVFVAIGLFASSISSNQIIAFVLGVFLCFFLYMAFDYLSRLDLFIASIDNLIASLGIYEHYQSISRGVVDTRDLVYFLSVIALFLLLTKTSLESRKW
ncbi:MAG: gliding motility-associated ABC transporter permease subunit GldF [Bacteroidetes bacterium SW_11_45_7]|jgi:ABC-2 type transport system permease protein|nr:MAG: gliding motility-associated ABC transporter permease subunit GldF [Bacteroidetes bacterium SW_11_45_7]